MAGSMDDVDSDEDDVPPLIQAPAVRADVDNLGTGRASSSSSWPLADHDPRASG
jgi:hypothetical protein